MKPTQDGFYWVTYCPVYLGVYRPVGQPTPVRTVVQVYGLDRSPLGGAAFPGTDEDTDVEDPGFSDWSGPLADPTASGA